MADSDNDGDGNNNNNNNGGGRHQYNNNNNNRGGNNQGGGNQQKNKAPVIVDMQFASWLRFAQICVFSLNALLNWVCLWFFAPPLTSVVIKGVEQPPDTIWSGWMWWVLSLLISAFMQIVLLYVPMFVDENSKFYGRWRKILQRTDTYLNYTGWTIILCFVMGVAPDLRDFLSTMWGILNQLVIEFGGILNLKILVTIGLIWILSTGTHKLGLITTLVPRTQVKK